MPSINVRTSEFWELGHELFRSTATTFPVHFVSGDIMDPSFLSLAPTLPTSSNAEPRAALALSSVRSLNELHGHVSAIFTGAFFHLFTEEDQLQAARQVASLLSPESGSIIFGQHAALAEKGLRAQQKTIGGQGTRRMFCHDPDSWAEMWNDVFEEGTIKVEAELQRMVLKTAAKEDEHMVTDHHTYWLNWTVTRL